LSAALADVGVEAVPRVGPDGRLAWACAKDVATASARLAANCVVV